LNPDPVVVPFDIGHHRALGQNQIARSDWAVVQEVISSQSNHLMKVSTYKDPSVNKERMFKELQTTFHWDAFD